MSNARASSQLLARSKLWTIRHSCSARDHVNSPAFERCGSPGGSKRYHPCALAKAAKAAAALRTMRHAVNRDITFRIVLTLAHQPRGWARCRPELALDIIPTTQKTMFAQLIRVFFTTTWIIAL